MKIKYDPKIKLDDVVTAYIIDAVEYHNNKKTEAANALGVSLKTIYNTLKRKDVFDKFIVSGYKSRTLKRK